MKFFLDMDNFPAYKGEKFAEENIRVVRLGYGLESKYYENVLGQIAICNMAYGTSFQ